MIKQLIAGVALATASGLACAQAYPNQPIRMIIPSTPGGGTDFIGRLVSTRLAELNGWTVLPINRPGAGTALGLAEGAKANPAGYDLVIGQTDNVTLIPLLMKVAYDPVKDLTPVANVATTPMVLIVKEDSPYKKLGDAIAAAKAAPGKIAYGTSGTGGQVGFAGSSISSAATLTHAGKIRALAVTSPKRNQALPDVPTVAESGYKDYSVVSYYGVFGPAGMPQAVVARLNADINKLLARPDVRTALLGQGLEPHPLSTDEFAALIRDDIRKNKDVIASAGIKVE
ncbi:MAG: tripartite tricarboxylate transporter substrate binding protein [Betaproteobacteria bacterium]|nr:tripartite tricarboxylate transporter substrate binding protein [Betaproteobacteria bacterium]